VLTHPRCMRCHPKGDHPLQGTDHHEHMPRVWRNDTGKLGHPLHRVSQRRKFHVARGRQLSEHSRPSTLGARAAVDGLGRQNYR
jgi:hypothetical protein